MAIDDRSRIDPAAEQRMQDLFKQEMARREEEIRKAHPNHTLDFYRTLTPTEKVYFVGAQLSACTAQISFIGLLINPDACWPYLLGGTLGTFGGLFALQRSYNKNHPGTPMSIGVGPGIRRMDLLERPKDYS